jgi:hypothetical protein
MCEHLRDSFRKVSTRENFRKFSITIYGLTRSVQWVHCRPHSVTDSMLSELERGSIGESISTLLIHC